MKPELLSPAGSPEALRAAVQSGADAVYLGWGQFNARQNAKNFTDEEFAEAIQICHERGVRVYLTLNTLVTDRELPSVLDTARQAATLGVDAVLVQDWGLFALLRDMLPDLPVHASTQMSLFTSGGACEAARLGCERVVIARECSAEDTAAICQNCPAEIEAFVHGALCMCYSGQCAMSALIGGRSGNRGRCAQPCRLPYTVDLQKPVGSDACSVGTVEARYAVQTAPRQRGNRPSSTHAHFPLSLKDNCLAGELEKMERMGVACLKLEGRMKRPEYVAIVTEIYARLLQEHRAPTAAESAELEQAFSRQGFTDCYWQGQKGPEMFGTRPEDAVEPKELFSAAKAAYESGTRRTVPVSMRCEVRSHAPAVLTVSDLDGHIASATGPVPEDARSHAVTTEELEARLRKTGGTAYRCETVSVAVGDGLSLSAAAINALRREALSGLTDARCAHLPCREFPMPALPVENRQAASPEFTVSVAKWEQITPALLDCNPARIYVPLELLAALDTLPKSSTAWCAILPRIWRDREEIKLSTMLDHAKSLGVSGVLLGNLGHLPLVRNSGFALYGDYGWNLFNSRSLAFLAKQGLSSATVSFELRGAQIRDLQMCLPTEAIVYGRLPLMVTENCLVKNRTGCRQDHAGPDVPPCGDCAQPFCLTDRTGASFPLMPVWGHRTEVVNCKPLYLGDRTDYRQLGLSFARLRFTTESPEKCARIFHAYQKRSPAPESFTRGLFDRGVE